MDDYPDPGDFLEEDDYAAFESRYEDELEMMEEDFMTSDRNRNNINTSNQIINNANNNEGCYQILLISAQCFA